MVPIDHQPSLEEMLGDPLVRLVMAHDGVTREEVEELFDNLRAMAPRGGGFGYRVSVAPAPEAAYVELRS